MADGGGAGFRGRSRGNDRNGRRGSGGSRRTGCNGGSGFADDLYAVIADVINLSVLADRIPDIAGFLNGFPRQGQHAALSEPVLVDVIISVRLCPQVAGGQDQLNKAVSFIRGCRGRGRRNDDRSRRGSDHRPLFRSGSRHGGAAGGDDQKQGLNVTYSPFIADLIPVFHVNERRNGKNFHLVSAVQLFHAAAAQAGFFPEIDAAVGYRPGRTGSGGNIIADSRGGRSGIWR